MKATVVVTTYNRATLLAERSLPSALGQTFTDFEVIVLDDCSSDSTRAVVTDLMESHPRLRYVQQEVNRGLAAARNRGAKEATGEYVVFLDDDDALDPAFLKTTVPVLDGLPDIYGGVCGGRIVIYSASQKEYILPTLAGSLYVTIDDGMLLRRSVFRRISYDEVLRADEDADFGIRFFEVYRAEILDKALLYKYSHPVQASHGAGISLRNDISISYPSEQRIASLRRYLAKNQGAFERRGNKKELAHLYRVTAGRNLCWAGELSEGIPYMWKAVRTRPEDPRNILHLFFALLALVNKHVYVWYFSHEIAFERYVRSRFMKRAPTAH